ncbi:hypothetical protein Dsin_008507 [Dipteronia sinensis]|uniref:DUF4283 domain-containing protein n=1 Tax=Dipteronia sinensis TaxID=43782 RepID=A0AAE0EB89_9ROSI|nr:hypothetical protein Dsin_008507 [Dipteronia sinensis]
MLCLGSPQFGFSSTIMNSEEIAKQCASMTLKDTEGTVRRLNDDLMLEGIQLLSLNLVGKVLTTKMVNRDAFVRVLKKIWRVQNGVEIEAIRGNVFAFHFMNREDLRRIWASGPWTFDDAMIVLVEPTGKGEVEKFAFNRDEFWVQIHHGPLMCMSKEIGRFLGGMVWEVMEVDEGVSGDEGSKFLQVSQRSETRWGRPDSKVMQRNVGADSDGGGNKFDINGNNSTVRLDGVSVMKEVYNNDGGSIVGQDVHLDHLDAVGQVGKDRPSDSSVTSERDEVDGGRVTSATSSLEMMVGSAKKNVRYSVGGQQENNLEIMGGVVGESTVVLKIESEHAMARNNFNARMLELVEEDKDDDYGILLGMEAVEGERLSIESRGPCCGGFVPGYAVTDHDRAEAPQGNKRKPFANSQESAQKDVKLAFRVLQACVLDSP